MSRNSYEKLLYSENGFEEYIRNSGVLGKLEALHKSLLQYYKDKNELRKLIKEGRVPENFSFPTSSTTIIAIAYKDGILMGSEKKVTAGYFTHSLDVEKIYRITPYFVIGGSGLVAEIEIVKNFLKEFINWYQNKYGEEPDTIRLSSVLYLISPFLWFSYYLVAGIGELYDKKKVVCYEIDTFLKLYVENYRAIGSGSVLGEFRGILESEWRKDITYSEALELLLKSLHSAVNFDHFSGNRNPLDFDIINITVNGIESVNLLDEVKKNKNIREYLKRKGYIIEYEEKENGRE